MDINTILAWASTALAIIALLGHAKTFFSGGFRELVERVKKAEKTLVDHDRRVQSVEGELKHLPSKDMVAELKISMAEMKGTVGTLTETMASISRTVHRIDDYLREESK